MARGEVSTYLVFTPPRRISTLHRVHIFAQYDLTPGNERDLTSPKDIAAVPNSPSTRLDAHTKPKRGVVSIRCQFPRG